jgi:Cd2+/Zn2+-exporting ATPase
MQIVRVKYFLYFCFSVKEIDLLILATLTGLASIGIAVAIHEGSTLIVVINALRLLRYKGYNLI